MEWGRTVFLTVRAVLSVRTFPYQLFPVQALEPLCCCPLYQVGCPGPTFGTVPTRQLTDEFLTQQKGSQDPDPVLCP